MNLFSFTGNIGKDAEVRYTQSGAPICNFSVAVKSGYGEREKTNWVRCSIFGKKAESQLPQYLKKGTQVAISGELTLEEWEGQNGKGSALSVSVQNIDLIGGKPDNQQAAPQQGYSQTAPQQAPMQQPPAQPQYGQQNGYAQAQQTPQQAPQNQMPPDQNIPF